MFSFAMKVGQSLHCLPKRGDSMFYCAKTSIGGRSINTLFQIFPLLGHGTITAVLKCSFIQFLLLNLNLFVTVNGSSFATQTNHFSAAEFFLK